MDRTPQETLIPGLLVLDVPLHVDDRGWFKENWHRARMVEQGLPDFGPVQQNVSFNHLRGVTRGVHAEPWDKLISVSTGRIFGAWVDLRAGATFGRVYTCEIGPDRVVFVPRGVGNGYQTLEAATTYAYLVNDHWSPARREEYSYLNLADESLAIPWPVSLREAVISEADRGHPSLHEVAAVPPRCTLVLGGGGQVGQALQRRLPDAHVLGRDALDITALAGWDWGDYDVVINAAAITGVDAAETVAGRRSAWAVNAAAVSRLAQLSREHGFTLVHVSSDYVFDGAHEGEYGEDAAFSPLGVYGQSKAAGDLAASSANRHYIIRTSWVVGGGSNFVSTMMSLAQSGATPRVVNDQRGRLTFADTVADGISHLLTSSAPFGTYNVTNDGPVTTWYDVAREVFRLCGRSTEAVIPVTTHEFRGDRPDAPRPANSALSLTKIKASGYVPSAAFPMLERYVHGRMRAQ